MDPVMSLLGSLLLLIGVAYTAVSGRRNTAALIEAKALEIAAQIAQQRDQAEGERVIKANQVKLDAQKVELLTTAEARAWMAEARQYHETIINNLQEEARERTTRLTSLEQAVAACQAREQANLSTIMEQAAQIAAQALQIAAQADRITTLEARVRLLLGEPA